MSVNHTCVLIPVYNHPEKIEGIVHFIREKSLPVLLIDDGSESSCASHLLAVSANDEQVNLVRLENNQGKGAAVCVGLAQLYSQGFTHALQIDADGQHDLNDVEQFLLLSHQYPKAVVSASRPYEQMPSSRAKGRKITDFWVHINTLSHKIEDSMCGYRLYPLEASVKVIEKYAIAPRMAFDTDILVKLYWEGTEVKHIKSDVSYDQEAVSHFHLWKDNVGISLMHTRLFFGMLKRFFSLVRR